MTTVYVCQFEPMFDSNDASTELNGQQSTSWNNTQYNMEQARESMNHAYYG